MHLSAAERLQLPEQSHPSHRCLIDGLLRTDPTERATPKYPMVHTPLFHIGVSPQLDITRPAPDQNSR